MNEDPLRYIPACLWLPGLGFGEDVALFQPEPVRFPGAPLAEGRLAQ